MSWVCATAVIVSAMSQREGPTNGAEWKYHGLIIRQLVNQRLICEHSTIGFGTCHSTHGTWHG